MAEEVVRIVQTQWAHPDAEPTARVERGELIVRSSARTPASGVAMRNGQAIWCPPARASKRK